MKISIILAHPKPNSFNHVIADTAATTLRGNGHAVLFHDLCAENFDPNTTAAELPAINSQLYRYLPFRKFLHIP